LSHKRFGATENTSNGGVQGLRGRRGGREFGDARGEGMSLCVNNTLERILGGQRNTGTVKKSKRMEMLVGQTG